MALSEVTTAFLKRFRSAPHLSPSLWTQQCRRYALPADAAAVQETDELETTSLAARPSEKDIERYDPAGVARRRNERHSRRLPRSRYQYKPPRYYRGPLHPHQPPPESDPSSRLFVPGPFSLPRLEQTYHETFAPDYMTMTYTHFPPGFSAPVKGERLRSWIGDSPYFKNRPPRGPRGGDVLRLLRKPITFRNVPKLEKVTVHTMVKAATDDVAHLHVASMVLQSITGVRATAHKVEKSAASFGIQAGQYLSLTCELSGEAMYHFIGKLVDVVMPKIKDWPGVKGSSGDSSGNVALGLKAEEVALFPEVEVNYDMYPPKMIPGCHIFIHTSASTDRDARVLLTQIGVPFYGKLIN
ncbi:hypothetical protein BAUCODRAFT_121465 [Baudoinia panamericana UAMH 10762]|uniref:Large ribosomal subunit protein uL5m n=1 Tax=Baudoinia panamericana (strain UAMH 10762) TaxID=717646 RepID=M2NCL5_BAUPA|nr:uncharacterized protein BAUCODRAFT_121465 [Baudoinia panamericana UAMH 10762]EMC96924.1 hypothetical protein BAUCODRAFT_121465 [Baudoinia panamericana UAMH 10762]